MKVMQLSLFLENKPGRLSFPCHVLAQAGINILTLSLADTQQFGIMRLIVREWERAKAALEQAGCVVNATPVVAVEVADKPGGLQDVLEIMDKAGVNVEYMYAFTFRSRDRAVLVFRFEDPDAAVATLRAKGVHVISSADLYAMVERL